MQKADYWLRLMKQQTDALVVSDEKLQQFLMWVNEKSLSVEVPYKPVAVRAFYFALDIALVPVLVPVLDPSLYRALNPVFVPALNRALGGTLDSILGDAGVFEGALDLALDRVLDGSFDLALDLALDRALDGSFDLALDLAFEGALDLALDRARDRALKPKQRQVLQQLKKQLPDPDGNKEIYKQWWKTNGQAWTKQLREMMIWHRNIGHDWQFSEQQQEFLRQYYDANLLLVDCLNSSCNVTPSVRNEIEETLLLPTKMLPNAEG